MHRVPAEDLSDFVQRAGAAASPDGSASQLADFAAATVWADRVGRSAHGVWRLPTYLRRLEEGLIACPAAVRTIAEAPAGITLDGGNGFGQHLARTAVSRAVERAHEFGIACVAVQNSNHFGAGGFFVAEGAEAGCVTLLASSSFAKVAPHGGCRPVFGTNPLAVGVPRANGERPMLIDMATSATAGSTVLRAAERGERLPEGVLVDANGAAVTDPAAVDGANLLTFGGAKGSAIALLVELLATCLTGAGPSTSVRSMFSDFEGPAGIGHFVIAIDPARGGASGTFGPAIEALLSSVRASAPSHAPLRIPGDDRWRCFEESRHAGCRLDGGAVTSLRAVASRYDIALPAALA